ncbi:MAG: hypothetical protein V3V54_03205 [Candidatus Brocadiales bacterium]
MIEAFQVAHTSHPLEDLRHISPLLIVSGVCSTVVTAWLTHLFVYPPGTPHRWLIVLVSKIPRRAFSETCERLEKLPKDAVEFPGSLGRRIRYDKQRKLLVLKGILKQEDRDELLSMSKDVPYQKAVGRLYTYSLERLLDGLIPCEKLLESRSFRATWIAVTGVLWTSLILALLSLYWTPLAVASYWLLVTCIASVLVLMLILVCTSLKANRILEELSLDTVEKVIHVQSFYNQTLGNTMHELVVRGLLKGPGA